MNDVSPAPPNSCGIRIPVTPRRPNSAYRLFGTLPICTGSKDFLGENHVVDERRLTGAAKLLRNPDTGDPKAAKFGIQALGDASDLHRFEGFPRRESRCR